MCSPRTVEEYMCIYIYLLFDGTCVALTSGFLLSLQLLRNVKGFDSEYLAAKAAECGYMHVGPIHATGADVAVRANSRPRVCLNCAGGCNSLSGGLEADRDVV